MSNPRSCTNWNDKRLKKLLGDVLVLVASLILTDPRITPAQRKAIKPLVRRIGKELR